MKTRLLLPLVSLVLLIGCTTSQIELAYKTLYSTEHTVISAYDGYLDTVVKGQTSTNSVPTISKAYNTFQASYIIALDAAQYNTNALAPSALVQEANDVVGLIITAKGH